jgi:hypothetical protein
MFNLNPITLVQRHEADLFKLNMKLTQVGLPFYYLGDFKFNTEYRLYPTPRIVGMWFPPFYKVQQIYLIYKAGTAEQKDIVFDPDWFGLEITEPNKND